jgi:PAS domain S-box-containing protein
MADEDQQSQDERTDGEVPAATPELAAFVRENCDAIIDTWAEAARRDLASAKPLDRATLIDHVPPLLERIARNALSLGRGEAAHLPSDLAEKHAHARFAAEFGMEEVVGEYALLRDTILRMWEARRLPPRERGALPVLNLAIDRAVAATIRHYVEAHHRAHLALDRFGAQALESRSLDSLLCALLEIFLDATPSADTGMILLLDGDRLVPNVSVGLDPKPGDPEEIVPLGAGFSGRVAADGRARLANLAKEDGRVRSPSIRRRGLRALYGVPLMDREGRLGVAHVGSVSAESFSEEDRRLFQMLAHRAATAIRQQLLRDEADRRAAETAEALERSRRLERLLSVHPDFFYLLDDAHRFVYVSPSLLELWGRSAEEALGRTFADLEYPQEIWRLHQRQLEEAFEGRTVRGENPYVGPDGVRRYYEYIFAPVFGDRGKVALVAGVTRDITDRKETEEMQKRLAEDARRAARQREELVAVVSHDLRNPLGAVSLSTHLLASLLEDASPPVRRQLEVIQRAVGTMERLIGDLLDAARIQAGVVDLSLAHHRMEGILEDAAILHEPLSREAGVDLVLSDGEAIGEIVCDRERILQVLSNLLGNAVKACGPGDRVILDVLAEPSSVRIEVRDTGPGIAEDVRDRLFEAYESGDRRGRSGTGLGLYIARGIVEAHGGEIGFETRLGEGTTFWVRLPRGVDPES